MDYNRSYSFRYKDSANVSQMEAFDSDKINQFIISDYKSVGSEQAAIQENPLSQYKVLQQFSTQLLLENVNTGNRVIYKEFYIPTNKTFKEQQNELMLRKQIEQENVLSLNFYLIEKQQMTQQQQKQKFGIIFDNFIRDFDSELETRKQNKKNVQELIKKQNVNISSKEQLYSTINKISKINNIPLFWSEEELINTIESVLTGIYQLHKLNIIHGDLSAQSVVFCDDGCVKIADQFVINHEFYQKDTPELYNSSYIPPENTVYTAEGDLWAIGMIFLEAATLENSQDIYNETTPKYKRNPKHLLNNSQNFFQQQRQIDFQLIKQRIEDIKFLATNSEGSKIFQTIISNLLSVDPKNRFKAYEYIQSSNNLPEQQNNFLNNKPLINIDNNQTNSNYNTNTNINNSLNTSLSQNIMNNQGINKLIQQKQNNSIKINQKELSLSDINVCQQFEEQSTQLERVPTLNISLQLQRDIIEAHESNKYKQNNKQKEGKRQNILNISQEEIQQQILSQQNISSSNLSFCTQISNASQISNNKKQNNQEQQQQQHQFKQDDMLKENNLIKNQFIDLNQRPKVQKLNYVSNTEADIPSLDISLIDKQSPNQIQQSKSQQISKSFIQSDKENQYKIKQNLQKQIQTEQKDIQIKILTPQNLPYENIQKKNNKNPKILDLINLTQKSRQSTLIDFHLSNPSNMFGLESPRSLSIDSQSCKSQQFHQFFQNQQKLQKQSNQILKESSFPTKDNSQIIQEYSQITKENNSLSKEYQSLHNVSNNNKQTQKNNAKVIESLNCTSDQIGSQRSSNQNTQRKRSTSIQPLENESCFKNDDIKISIRKCFDQQTNKNQINNQNYQNKLNHLNLNEIQIQNQMIQQQQTIPQKQDFFINCNERKQQQQKQQNSNTQNTQLTTSMNIQQESLDGEKNERAKSSLSLRKQYSNLTNMVDSCLQRSRSVISNNLQQRNYGLSIIDRQFNNQNQSFQNTSYNSQNIINCSYILKQSHLQTTQKKNESQTDLQQSFDGDQQQINLKSDSSHHKVQQNGQNGEQIQQQTQGNNLNKQKINNYVMKNNQPTNQIRQQDSPLTSQRRSLPPKSSSRSSKKGIKMECQIQTLNEQYKSANDNLQQQHDISNQNQNNIEQNIQEKQINVQIDRDLINIQNAYSQNHQNQGQFNILTNIQINESQIFANQCQNNSQMSSNQSMDYLQSLQNQNFENSQNSINQSLEINLKRSRELRESIINQIQQPTINQSQKQINKQLQEETKMEENNNKQINQIEQERQKTNEQININNEQIQSSSCLGESFQVFKANGSESNSELQQESSNFDSSQLTENDLLIKQNDNTDNRYKTIPKQIDIKVQNFTYNDEWINYQGQYFNNTFSGVGYLQLKNNCSYHGEFLMGKLNGYGSFFIGCQNQIILGYFQNNVLIKKCN